MALCNDYETVAFEPLFSLNFIAKIGVRLSIDCQSYIFSGSVVDHSLTFNLDNSQLADRTVPGPK
ncbi:hypothetical protein A9Q83_13480 [Alphaproteobacteria bacterium 46_93_T64]|nr:hypothetical protein A9Q83_13480 [Alphaproteobacteria bacterium 46_93_T64]